ncbi:calcium-binding protein [Rhizobium sp. G21]|uniref:calcium-binding protein n=1 Tax=Rhizobium sp. G21 TaxID=2758439 RepID=UPI0016029243|nr:hypothetical protein [Rhizobium sp. G21]MBB1250508.1 hypothetical protein [Rhizobium sp. G21]
MTNKISKYFTTATDELFDKISTDSNAAQSYTVSGRFDWRLSAAGGNDVVTVAIGKANSVSIFALDLGAGSDTLYGGREHDYVLAGKGDDTLLSGGGGDKLYGQAGDDLLAGGEGRNLLNGGKGDDAYLASGNDTIIDNGGDNLITVANDATVKIELTKGADATLVFNTDIDDLDFMNYEGDLIITTDSFPSIDDNGDIIAAKGETQVQIKISSPKALNRSRCSPMENTHILGRSLSMKAR